MNDAVGCCGIADAPITVRELSEVIETRLGLYVPTRLDRDTCEAIASAVLDHLLRRRPEQGTHICGGCALAAAVVQERASREAYAALDLQLANFAAERGIGIVALKDPSANGIMKALKRAGR